MSRIINNLEALKTRLVDNKIIQHYYDGDLSETRCTFYPPAAEAEIDHLANKKNWSIPREYKQFLMYSNGAKLFKDEYGTGFDLLSVIQMDEYHLDFMPKNWIPVVYYVGDYFFINSDKVDSGSNYLMFHNHEQTFEIPTLRFSIDFSTWLERLIITHGAPFWEWEN